MRPTYQKKVRLGVVGRQIKWAPFWAVLRKFGKGKRVHPSEMTAYRRHWRRTKLKMKPRRNGKNYLG